MAKIFFRFDNRRVVMVVGNVLKDVNYDCSNDLEIISKKLTIHEAPVQEVKKEKSIIKRFFKNETIMSMLWALAMLCLI